MKIYISLPENNDRREDLSVAMNHLKELGHNLVVSDKLSEKNDKAIKDTDLMIVEISDLNYRQGFEIARALDEKKVVIALELEDGVKNKELPKNKSLMLRKYNSDNITSVIDKVLKEALKKLDSKFILIISPEIDRYLQWAGQHKRMHKAQVVRNAVEQMIKKDRDYKDYLG